jgi:hypothetical protein
MSSLRLQGLRDGLRGLLARCLGLLMRLLVDWWCGCNVEWCIVDRDVECGVV